MIPVSDPAHGLEVSRDDLSKAIGIVAGMARKWNKGVSLRFEDGMRLAKSTPRLTLIRLLSKPSR
jgi:hypothetical protein